MSLGLVFNQNQVTYKARAYTYVPILARTARPIDISDLKPHLKIDFIDQCQENYINMLIDAAVDTAERFTNRSFINQKWKTYRDFPAAFFELRRGTNGVVNTFQYWNLDNVLVDVDPTIYYTKVADPYSQIILQDDQEFPLDIANKESCIEITFTAGYGASKSVMPPSLRLLLLQHVVWLYENKGNCPVNDMPPMVRDGYMKHFRVINLNAATYI